MGIVAGDEYGVLRVVSKALTKPWNSASAQTEHGKADKAHAITSLCLADTEPTFIIAARANGSVTLHEPKTLNEVAVLAGASSGKAVHAGAVQSATDADVAVASENGCIRQYQVTKGLEGHLNPVGSYLETGKELTCCQFSTEGPLACVGSRVKEVTVWNLQSGSQVHALKPTRGDPQTLLNDRPWTTCVQWLPKGQLLCGTAHHKVRLYDVEAQKRPVVQLSWLDASVTALSPTLEQGITWVANAKGFIQGFDTRTQNMAAALKGQIAGSVRSLQSHENLLCSVSIDKWLRIHDTRTRQMLCKVYLKQPLTSCIWSLSVDDDTGCAKHMLDENDPQPVVKRVRVSAVD